MCIKNIFRRKRVRFDGIPEKIVRRWKVCDVLRGADDKIIKVTPIYVKRKKLTTEWLRSWHSRESCLSRIWDSEYIAGFHVFTKKKDARRYLRNRCDHLTFYSRLEVMKVECCGLLASGNMKGASFAYVGGLDKIEAYEYIRLIE